MKNNICVGICSSFFSIVLFVAIVMWLCPVKFKPIYMLNSTKIVKSKNKMEILTSSEQHIVAKLVNDGMLVTPQEYTDNLGDYYNSLITILGVLLGFSAFFGYFIVRENTKKVIKDEADSEMRRYFADSKLFDDRLRDFVSGKFDDVVSVDDFDDLTKQFEERITKLEESSDDKDNIIEEGGE